MSNQCCPTKSLCIDPSSPVQNFSAEAPDLTLFIGESSGWDNSDGGYNTPPIGGTWSESGCQSTCISTISQADADQCAANQQIACADGTWNNPPNNPTQNFCNQQQTCDSFCPDGLPFAFTVPAGSVCDTNQARADQLAGALACQDARRRRICLSSLSAVDVCLNTKYNGTITASGGLLSPTSNSWSLVSGVLPPGLDFAGSVLSGPFESVVTGPVLSIVGTPTQSGTFGFTVRVTAPNGDFMTKAYTICVIDIFPATLADGTTGTTYAQQLSAPCGTGPLNWQVTSGALPNGLSLDQNTGIISGTPSAPGTFNFTVTLQTSAS